MCPCTWLSLACDFGAPARLSILGWLLHLQPLLCILDRKEKGGKGKGMTVLGKQNFPRNLQLTSYRPELCHTLAVTPSWEGSIFNWAQCLPEPNWGSVSKEEGKRISGTLLAVLGKKFTFIPLHNNTYLFIHNLDCKQYILTPIMENEEIRTFK